MPAGLGFIVQAILGMMGSQNLLHVGTLSVRLSEGFLVLMTVSCEVQLCLVSCICEYGCSVPSYHVSGQEQTGCGRSHLGCVSGVLSGIHVL